MRIPTCGERVRRSRGSRPSGQARAGQQLVLARGHASPERGPST
ncbi:hypothetical protein ACFPRL_27500 [Pseudoclavibacter helvolus]